MLFLALPQASCKILDKILCLCASVSLPVKMMVELIYLAGSGAEIVCKALGDSSLEGIGILTSPHKEAHTVTQLPTLPTGVFSEHH